MRLLLTQIIVALLYLNGYYIHKLVTTPVVPAWEQPMVVDQQELDLLQEIHGTMALKIEGSRVFIWREGKWLDITEWRERNAGLLERRLGSG